MKLLTITALPTIFALILSGCASTPSTPSIQGSVSGLGDGKYRAYNTGYNKQGMTRLADNDMRLTCNRLGKSIHIIVSQEESRKGEIKSGNKALDTAVEFTKFGQQMGEKASDNPYEVTSIFKCE